MRNRLRTSGTCPCKGWRLSQWLQIVKSTWQPGRRSLPNHAYRCSSA